MHAAQSAPSRLRVMSAPAPSPALYMHLQQLPGIIVLLPANTQACSRADCHTTCSLRQRAPPPASANRCTSSGTLIAAAARPPDMPSLPPPPPPLDVAACCSPHTSRRHSSSASPLPSLHPPYTPAAPATARPWRCRPCLPSPLAALPPPMHWAARTWRHSPPTVRACRLCVPAGQLRPCILLAGVSCSVLAGPWLAAAAGSRHNHCRTPQVLQRHCHRPVSFLPCLPCPPVVPAGVRLAGFVLWRDKLPSYQACAPVHLKLRAQQLAAALLPTCLACRTAPPARRKPARLTIVPP